jgi:hypothetical protein
MPRVHTTRAVRAALLFLRIYLIFLVGLIVYKFLTQILFT